MLKRIALSMLLMSSLTYASEKALEENRNDVPEQPVVVTPYQIIAALAAQSFNYVKEHVQSMLKDYPKTNKPLS